jgi:hypothetical protein
MHFGIVPLSRGDFRVDELLHCPHHNLDIAPARCNAVQRGATPAPTAGDTLPERGW